MISLGFDPKKKKISQIIDDLDQDKNGTIDFEEFLELMTSRMSGKSTKEDYDRVFKLFVGEEPCITFENLKRVCQEIGETLTDEEIHNMINRASSK